MTAARSRIRADIQGMRAIAVLAVFANHALGYPVGGFVGVDIFFVISGFLITGLLVREYERTGRISILGFYRRRIRRLGPAAVVTIVLTVLAAKAVFYPARSGLITTDGIWSFFFAANWRFILQSTDYFAADGPVSPFQHFWSLSVEEQYYIMWPWLMMIVLAIFVARMKQKLIRVLAIVLGTIIVISFGAGFFAPFTSPSIDYFNTVTRVWELGLGALLAVLAPLLTHMSTRVRNIFAVAGLALVFGSLMFQSAGALFPVPWALVPVSGAALMITAGTGASAPALGFLGWSPIRYVGDISYSLYLWHFPALVFGQALFAPLGSAWLPLSVLLGFLLAIISYHLIEQPVLSSPWLRQRGGWLEWWRRSRRAIVRFGAAAVVTCVTIIGWGVADRALAAPAASVIPGDSVEYLLREAVQSPVMSAAALSGLTQPADMAWSLGADTPCLNQTQVRSLSDCHSGKGNRRALVIGDSFAAATFPAVADALNTQGYESVGVMNSSCPVSKARLDIPLRPAHEAACNARSKDLIGLVSRASADLVVVLDSESAYLGIATSGDREHDYRTARYAALKQLLGVSNVIVIEANPISLSASDCLSRLTASSARCLGTPSTAWTEKVDIDRGVTSELGIPYVATKDLYCADAQCPVAAGDVLQRIDTGHLTSAYVGLITPEMTKRVSQAVLELKDKHQ